jgi:chorismate dehydratase
MAYAVAAVSFLNTVPLIEQFVDPGDQRVQLSRALPSRLAALLAEGKAEVALLPVVEILRGKSGGMIPGTGIACRGPVDSVKLFWRGELQQIRRIRTDRGSRTSVALLEVLFREWGHSVPELTAIEPRGDLDVGESEGALIIGDRCFAFEAACSASERGIRSLDLGEAWFGLTGLPFVFAAWAVAPDFPGRRGREAVNELTALLAEARDSGLARLDAIAAREASAGALGPGGRAGAEALLYYFRTSLRYVLGPEEMAGLRRFQELCVKHAVVPSDAALTVL